MGEGFLARRRRRRELRRLGARLPGDARRDYGRAGPYAPEQVRATMRRAGLPDALFPHALALLGAAEDFDRHAGPGAPSRDEALAELEAARRGLLRGRWRGGRGGPGDFRWGDGDGGGDGGGD